jgi:hypothetical protein
MTLIDEVNERTPVIDHDVFMETTIDMYSSSQNITLVQNYMQLPDDFKKLLGNVGEEHSPRLKRVLTMPPSVANCYWEKIKTSDQLLGPRVLRSRADMEIVTSHRRGNYILLGNAVTSQVLFVWAPAFEDEEAFAKHWQIFRYCFETGVIPMNNTDWKLWGVGETSHDGKRNRDGQITIKINNFSGTFRGFVDDSLNKGFERFPKGMSFEAQWKRMKENEKEQKLVREDHYKDLVNIMETIFETPFVFVPKGFFLPKEIEYDDLDIECALIPMNIEDFKPDTCYQYNVLTGDMEHPSIYTSFSLAETMTDVYSKSTKKDYMAEGVDPVSFGEKLTQVLRM